MVASARRTTAALVRSALSLALMAAAALTIGAQARAAENTASLVLRGFVPVRCEIAVAPTADATQLDLVRGHRELLVASVTERCNSGSGYTVSMSSRGNGELVGPRAAVGYRLRYQDASPSLAGSESAPVVVSDRTERTRAEGLKRELRISVPESPEIAGGWYADTVTITIAAK